jgi:hypothetical protein
MVVEELLMDSRESSIDRRENLDAVVPGHEHPDAMIRELDRALHDRPKQLSEVRGGAGKVLRLYADDHMAQADVSGRRVSHRSLSPTCELQV